MSLRRSCSCPELAHKKEKPAERVWKRIPWLMRRPPTPGETFEWHIIASILGEISASDIEYHQGVVESVHQALNAPGQPGEERVWHDERRYSRPLFDGRGDPNGA